MADKDSVTKYESCPMHAKIETEIQNMKERIDAHDLTVKEIFGKLDLITEKLLGRPGWAVTLFISVLMTAVGVLAAIAFK